ncbi:darcynin family protein [Burkholderia lata]|uniref:Uncharacterized protein n=1 Tax=Burkholderia lata (strain ATCC 17760 / DSM 23089 / LMG 22485 / NCIMB 9086 / R18194 / 383) TaxID=482957 RepID=A0A6P2WTK5_BURL3|nr:darcynin family protein [Burkholderia lata]VWD00262.1 hypothetical protein BLA18109_04522 [Burkholderia lata]
MSKRSYSRNALPPCQKGIGAPRQTATRPTLFILVKKRPEWPDFPALERLRPLREYIPPIRETQGERVSLHVYDTAFHSACVTDGGIGDAQDHHACGHVIDALRETSFRDHSFDIVESTPRVENIYETNDDAVALSAVRVHAGYGRDASAVSA